MTTNKHALARLIVLLTILFTGSSTLTAGGERPNSYNSPQQRVAFEKRAREFGRLWLSRRQRNIAPQLLKMLDEEPTITLRERMVIALGRLEDPKALKPLQELLSYSRQAAQQSSQFQWRDRIPTFRIQLALGRIRSRNLRGVARLNGVAQSIGKDWAGIGRMAKQLQTQLHDNKTSVEAQESDRLHVVEEFYDVLYRMGKRGENIRSLGAFNLVVWTNETSNVADGVRAQEQAKLFAATLSNRAEITFWLRRSLLPSTANLPPAHLLDLGPQMPALLKTYLQKCLVLAKTNPQFLSRTSAYNTYFEVAVGTNNQNFIPLLRNFEKLDDRWIKTYARRAIRNLQSGIGLASVRFPS